MQYDTANRVDSTLSFCQLWNFDKIFIKEDYRKAALCHEIFIFILNLHISDIQSVRMNERLTDWLSIRFMQCRWKMHACMIAPLSPAIVYLSMMHPAEWYFPLGHSSRKLHSLTVIIIKNNADPRSLLQQIHDPGHPTNLLALQRNRRLATRPSPLSACISACYFCC